jgi:hypothetical protein
LPRQPLLPEPPADVKWISERRLPQSINLSGGPAT